MTEIADSTHRQVSLEWLSEDIQRYAIEEHLSPANAAARVIMEWLGYDTAEVIFLDGRDRGIDAWLFTENGLEIFQIKTHNISDSGDIKLLPFNNEGVTDLVRAQQFLLHEKPQSVERKLLRDLLYRWDAMIRTAKNDPSDIPLGVTITLIILGEALTNDAMKEFEILKRDNLHPKIIDSVKVQFHPNLYYINDIINHKWREINREWKTKAGHKLDYIRLRPRREDFISDDVSAVFYCYAVDLVESFDKLGYQIFEPNVRSHIKKSKVNNAIQESVYYRQTRHEFRFLNNGVTIMCDSFTKPRTNKSAFQIIHPGVVNGLQTVVALSSAYQTLADEDKNDFEQNCMVLVRLMKKNAVSDINRVVVATNNQNPMKPRNLVSNTIEQNLNVRFFAEMGWFYEAKEGSWDAFEWDSKRWRPSLNKTAKDFRVPKTKRTRKVDNEQLAQTWLSFIGFSFEAQNNKKSLFEDKFYDLLFKKRTIKHGADYDFSLQRAIDEAKDNAPSPKMMLVSYITYKFATDMTHTAIENRRLTCERLKLNPSSMTKVDLEDKLMSDSIYLKNQILRGMTMLFTEYFGYMIYNALGEKFHSFSDQIINSKSIHTIIENNECISIKKEIDQNTFDQNDILIILWLIFDEMVDTLIGGPWIRGYHASSVRSRHIYSKETRELLFKEITRLDSYMKVRLPIRLWAVQAREREGLFEFIRRCIIKTV